MCMVLNIKHLLSSAKSNGLLFVVDHANRSRQLRFRHKHLITDKTELRTDSSGIVFSNCGCRRVELNVSLSAPRDTCRSRGSLPRPLDGHETVPLTDTGSVFCSKCYALVLRNEEISEGSLMPAITIS